MSGQKIVPISTEKKYCYMACPLQDSSGKLI